MKRCSWIIELHNNKDRTYRKGQNKMHFTDKRTTFYLFRSNYSFRIVIKKPKKRTRCSKKKKEFQFFESQHALKNKDQRNPVLLFCAEKTIVLIKCRGCWNEYVNTYPVAWLHIVSAFKSNHFCRWIVVCAFLWFYSFAMVFQWRIMTHWKLKNEIQVIWFRCKS